MVGPYSPHALVDHMGPVPLAIAVFLSVTALVALCAKHSGWIKRSPDRLPTASNKPESEPNLPATTKSPRACHLPKQLLASIGSHKAPIQTSKKKETNGESRAREEGKREAVEGFGEGGVWQRSILMGERCRPPEFSGAIHYDSKGNRLAEPPPRSPRLTPLPSFFSVAVQKGSE